MVLVGVVWGLGVGFAIVRPRLLLQPPRLSTLEILLANTKNIGGSWYPLGRNSQLLVSLTLLYLRQSTAMETHEPFSLFKYWCRARAHRLTRKSFPYACLSQAIVDGGFFVAWIVRLSAIPTCVFLLSPNLFTVR